MVHAFNKSGTQMSVAGYISKSKSRGIYRYRRRIPQELRGIWGKLEQKMSLKTKSHPEALRRAAVVNTKFDEKAAQLRKQISGKTLSNRQVMEAAREILVKEGIHPQQIPKTKEEALRFFKTQDEWKDIWHDVLPGVTEVNHTPNDRGGWDAEYETDESNPWYQAYNLLTGEEGLSMIPTLQEATETYLTINAEDKKRTPHNQKKHEGKAYRAIRALAPLDTPITEINRQKARRHKDALMAANPTWADDTLSRGINTLSAIFNSAIKEYELSMTNPWTGLTGTVQKNADDLTSEDRGNKRRPMTPNEIANYKRNLLKINPQASLIGQLMIQIGCRTMEPAGLLIRDLIFDTNVPYIQFRYNRIRTLKNKNSVRDVPVVGDLLDSLRAYVSSIDTANPDAPLFPKYGRDGGMDAISATLRKIVNDKMGLKADKTCVPYSTRHSMKDKLRALRTPMELQYAILGNGKRTVAEGYGDGNPLAYLQQEVIKAEKLESWGK